MTGIKVNNTFWHYNGAMFSMVLSRDYQNLYRCTHHLTLGMGEKHLFVNNVDTYSEHWRITVLIMDIINTLNIRMYILPLKVYESCCSGLLNVELLGTIS